MKMSYFLLFLTLLIISFVKAKFSKKQSLKNSDNKKYTLIIDSKSIGRPHDTIIHKKTYSVFHIPVKLINNTKSPLNYLTMSCSWDELFHLDNEHLEISGWGCDKNISYVETLSPYKSSIFLLPIVKNKNLAMAEKLKIGMNIFIDNKQNEGLFPLPVDKMDNVIWSNEIKIP